MNTNLAKVLVNPNKWIDQKILADCFRVGKILKIDKRETGNGFTNALSNKSITIGKTNIIVCPNQKVAKDKKEEFLKGGNFAKHLREDQVAFIYSDVRDKFSIYHPGRTALLVIVADSFVNRWDQFKDRIDCLMVDEFHTAISDSYRDKLKEMIWLIENEVHPEASIALVTATPTNEEYNKVDIVIENLLQTPKDLHLSNSRDDSIEKVVTCLQDKKNVLLFTNEVGVANAVLDKKLVDSFRLISGASFKKSISSNNLLLVDNIDSQLTVVTSTGFEGWSDNRADLCIFMFINTNKDYSTPLGSNIVQAIGRARKGYDSAEVCVVNEASIGGYKTGIPELSKVVDTFISNATPASKKMSGKFEIMQFGRRYKYQHLKQYMLLQIDYQGKPILKKFQYSIDAHNERYNVSLDLNEYNQLFNDRKINLTPMENDTLIPLIRFKTKKDLDKMIKTIKTAAPSYNLYAEFPDWFFDKPYRTKYSKTSKENGDKFLKYCIKETENLIYVKEQLEVKVEDSLYKLLEFYTDADMEKKIDAEYRKGLKEKGLTKREQEAKLEKREKKRKDKKVDEMFMSTLDIAWRVVMNRYSSGMVGFREFSSFTQTSMYMINWVCDQLGKRVIEADIKTCNPRIVYALCGETLPDNFYGENKKNKNLVNITLNNSRYKTKTKSGKVINTPEAMQKINYTNRLKHLGFNDKTTDLVMGYFNSEYKSDFYDFMTYHEKNIIETAMKRFTELNGDDWGDLDGLILRRHDSFLYITDLDKPIYLSEIDNYTWNEEGIIGGFFEKKENITGKKTG